MRQAQASALLVHACDVTDVIVLSLTSRTQVNRECGKHKRPPYSYMHLIQMAICSTPDRRMTLKQIYTWIEHKFPYYRHHPNRGWRVRTVYIQARNEGGGAEGVIQHPPAEQKGPQFEQPFLPDG